MISCRLEKGDKSARKGFPAKKFVLERREYRKSAPPMYTQVATSRKDPPHIKELAKALMDSIHAKAKALEQTHHEVVKKHASSLYTRPSLFMNE